MKDNTIFGPFLDFVFVIKFQNRGSERDQRLLWVANAPNLHGLDSNQMIFLQINILHVIVMNQHQTSMKFKNIITKKHIEKKFGLFFISIFHGPYGKNTNS
jgi:hypothetical protein